MQAHGNAYLNSRERHYSLPRRIVRAAKRFYDRFETFRTQSRNFQPDGCFTAQEFKKLERAVIVTREQSMHIESCKDCREYLSNRRAVLGINYLPLMEKLEGFPAPDFPSGSTSRRSSSLTEDERHVPGVVYQLSEAQRAELEARPL